MSGLGGAPWGVGRGICKAGDLALQMERSCLSGTIRGKGGSLGGILDGFNMACLSFVTLRQSNAGPLSGESAVSLSASDDRMETWRSRWSPSVVTVTGLIRRTSVNWLPDRKVECPL